MPITVLVRPNVERFRQLIGPNESEEAFAKRLNISRSSLRNILNGTEVSKPTIEKIASVTGEPFKTLVSLTSACLPSAATFYTKLRHGWFIENNKQRSGTPAWFRESIKLQVDQNHGAEGGGLRLIGRIKNQLNGEFCVKAELVGQKLLSMVCTRTSRMESDMSFVAGLTTYVKVEKTNIHALCGTWTGHNHVGVPAVYRYVVTNTDMGITHKSLHAICSKARVAVVLDADEFAFPISPGEAPTVVSPGAI